MRWIFLAGLCAVSGMAQPSGEGKQQFLARCVGCHGEDGSGGGHGPAIVRLREPKTTTAAQVREAILMGLPDGMPAFTISESEASAIADFVMTLKNSTGAAVSGAPGDAAAGARFFAGSGNCVQCHMVRGRGGVLGPDLSNIARMRTAAQLEHQLRDPQSTSVSRAVTVHLKTGLAIRGIARNESAFDLQVLGVDQKIHLLLKSDVAQITREKSLMPALHASVNETRDLVAYLSRLTFDWKAPVAGTDSGSLEFPAGSWPAYNGRWDGNRFSALNQINTNNVSRLTPKWMFSIPGTPRPLQVTPVVADGVMYVTSVNEAWALDARSGREIWHFSRPRTKGLAGDAASGINRGVALLGDRVFLVVDNAHLVALHRLTGQLLWDAEMANGRQNYGATGAPLVVDDLVIAGVSGGDEGIRGFLDAYRATTGERVWRFWTVPARGEPASETWSGSAIEHGCGATWLTGTYDPEARLLYWPTGNPCPDYNGGERGGDNLYTSSVVALDPATGRLKWHYQFTPHDLHDWDATETPVLIDAMFQGRIRKLMLHGNRNGFFYVLDRLTGKVLLAEPFVKRLTWASGIGADGRPILLPGNETTAEGQLTCPAVAGAANWPSSAFSPATGLYYLFAEESCNVYSRRDEAWKAGESFYGGGTRKAPGETGGKFLRALDIQTGKVRWEIPDIGGGILGSGLMATAGGLVFFADGNGAFLAAGAQDGRILWHFNAGAIAKGGPMTYMVDGTQYFAAAAGSGIISFGLN